MTQPTFSVLEFGVRRKQTHREKFLAEMEKVTACDRLFALTGPTYPKGKNGHSPYPLNTMLRTHFVKQGFELSNQVMTETLYENHAERQFAGLSLTHISLPDETTALNLRRLLEKHQLVAQGRQDSGHHHHQHTAFD